MTAGQRRNARGDKRGSPTPRRKSAGQSAGGAYPNPHSKAAKGKQGSFMGHGGESEIRYYGGADEQASGGDINSVTEDE